MMEPLNFFKALADDTRLKSLLLIQHEGELCVCELMAALDESQPKISRHLALLRKEGLLEDTRQGQWVFYRLNPELPQWSKGVLVSTLAENPELLTQPLTLLNAMGNRPERQQTCCA